MLELIKALPQEDYNRITNYITEWGVQSGYKGNDLYLADWDKSKRKLYNLLGRNFIYKFPCSVEKNEKILIQETDSMFRKYNHFISELKDRIYNESKNNAEVKKVRYNIEDMFYSTVWVKGDTITPVKLKLPDKKGTLQIPEKTKIAKALQKLIKYFEWDDLLPDFEKMRIHHSMIFNNKNLTGNLCISIHPLDFITMSDNASDWSSCMTWTKASGCYRIGTVEMMNSNNVVCCYLESSEPFHFGRKKLNRKGEEWEWNNKKWRQLFYVTKDIIVSGKAYPYQNKDLTFLVLNKLRELAEANKNWKYSFGPEKYLDMKHIHSNYRMENNKFWISVKNTKKHNIIFDSKGMYNDMFNDHKTDYWCVRNKVKHNIVLSYSGKSKCLCCNNDVLYENDDMYYSEYETDYYNERFQNTSSVICSDCNSERICDYCSDDNHGYYDIFEWNGDRWCLDCWERRMKLCPDCGKPFSMFKMKDFLIRTLDEKIYIDDVYSAKYDYKVLSGTCCPECFKKKVNSFEIVEEVFELDPSIEHYSWEEAETRFITRNIYLKDSDYAKKYEEKNLKMAPFPQVEF